MAFSGALVRPQNGLTIALYWCSDRTDFDRLKWFYYTLAGLHKTCGTSQIQRGSEWAGRSLSKRPFHVAPCAFWSFITVLVPIQTKIQIDSSGSYYEVLADGLSQNKTNGIGVKKLEQAQISLNDCLACRYVPTQLYSAFCIDCDIQVVA